jgi:hypothetical protein
MPELTGKVTERAHEKWMGVVLYLSKYLQLKTAGIQSPENWLLFLDIFNWQIINWVDLH